MPNQRAEALAVLARYRCARIAADAYRGNDPIEAKRLADARQEAARALAFACAKAAESEE